MNKSTRSQFCCVWSACSLLRTVGISRIWLLVALISGAVPIPLFGHGDVHESIVAVSEEIKAAPENAELYLRRGSLHRIHQDWVAAMADFDKAATLNPALKIVDLARSEVMIEQGRLSEAEAAVSRYIESSSEDPRGWGLRGRINATKGKWEEAAEDFGQAVRVAPQLEPQLILDHVRALRESGHDAAALQALDGAIQKSGPLVVLVQPAIELEERAGQIDAALQRLDRAMAVAPRKERWLAQKGEMLERHGRRAEAKAAFEEALQKFGELPVERQRVAAMAAFEKKVREAISRLTPAEN